MSTKQENKPEQEKMSKLPAPFKENLSNLRTKFYERKVRQNQNSEYLSSPERIKRRILNKESSFAAVEAYKAARTNLLFTHVGDGCQTVAFTSSYAGEGKTVNCANMALTLAQNGQKVLIIDADMRRPMLHHMFNISNKNGLSEFLAGISTDGRPITTISLQKSPDWELYILPSGPIPPNPAELLASGQMRALLARMAENFDYILIDTPPLGVVTDAAVLAKLVTGYVLVVRAGVTPLEGLQNAVTRLEQLDANLLGFMLNDLDAKTGSYKYSGYRSYKYGKYGYKKYGYYRKYGYHSPYDTLDTIDYSVPRDSGKTATEPSGKKEKTGQEAAAK